MKKQVKQNDSNYNKRAIPIKSLPDCKRLLARIIWLRQKDLIDDNKAKTLAYLVSKYSELTKIEALEEIEKRLNELESRSKDNGS